MLKLITPPAAELITVEEAAEFMRAEFSDSEETLIEALISTARLMCEEYLFRRIGVQTVELRDKGFPVNNAPIVLPAPLRSVTSIKYLDSNNVEQTLDSDEYIVSDSEPGLIIPLNSWPVASGAGDSLRVRFVAGYDDSDPGESPATGIALPQTIKTAMLMQIADLFENRDAQVEKPLVANQTLVNLLSPYRLEMGT
ncbi:MAG: head-tail connector protein [Candidatus Omnitrophota bacterium]|jgi:uncharacterized phiE125 gp8 family phage protein